MKVHRQQRSTSPACALTIGNFDGVHRGHQAMLALLVNEARHRGLPAVVLTFEPNPRDYFAALSAQPDRAPARIAPLRDKLAELERCGIDEVVLMRFNAATAALTPQAFVQHTLHQHLRARYVLVGDDFRFGARRAGDYALLDTLATPLGMDVARMMSYEVHGLRVSSSAVRDALARGAMAEAASLLGRPYRLSGRVIHGQKLGRHLGAQHGAGGFRTLNLKMPDKPAAQGIFVVQVHGLAPQALPGVASLGVRPSVEDQGRVLLEVHCLEWPLALEGGYGRRVQVDLLHKLHDERHYDGLPALEAGIAQDVLDARAWWAALRNAGPG